MTTMMRTMKLSGKGTLHETDNILQECSNRNLVFADDNEMFKDTDTSWVEVDISPVLRCA